MQYCKNWYSIYAQQISMNASVSHVWMAVHAHKGSTRIHVLASLGTRAQNAKLVSTTILCIQFWLGTQCSCCCRIVTTTPCDRVGNELFNIILRKRHIVFTLLDFFWVLLCGTIPFWGCRTILSSRMDVCRTKLWMMTVTNALKTFATQYLFQRELRIKNSHSGG